MSALWRRLVGMVASKAPAMKYVLIAVVAFVVLTYVWFDGWKAGVAHIRNGQMISEISVLRDERDRALEMNERYVVALREDRAKLVEIEETIQDAVEIASDDPAVSADVTQRLRDVFQGGLGPDRSGSK